VKHRWLLSLPILGLGMFALARAYSEQVESPPASRLSAPKIQYKSVTGPNYMAHMLLIPSQEQHQLVPAISETTALLASFVPKMSTPLKDQPPQVEAVINGGFFDPVNQKSTSYVVLNGKTVADPQQNPRLMDNPDLALYIGKILNRSEFRCYRCGGTTRYDITFHRDPIPSGCQLVASLGAGPQLLPKDTSAQEGFLDYANGVVIRDAIGHDQPNARTAIGITRDRHILWVMVAQKNNQSSPSGMSLPELANFMKQQGVEKALNLDGGSSSSFHHNGKTIYGKLDAQGNPVRRPVKSVLLVQRP
jgi:exopolysaccharide biosynthesis protein